MAIQLLDTFIYHKRFLPKRYSLNHRIFYYMINRSAHRYGKNDHISLIQANLKEMKDEVS